MIEKKTKQKNDDLSKEEFFVKQIMLSDKYNLYYNNFIRKFDNIDEFRIPLLLFDEFAQQRRYDPQNEIPQKISYFKLIDYFYSIKDNVIADYKDFCETKLGSFIIDYNYLFREYKLLNKKMTTKKTNKNNQLFYLDENITKKLLFHIKNDKLFLKNLKEKYKKVITTKSVESKMIFKAIKNCFIYNEILNENCFIKASLVFIFSIIFPIFSSNSIINHLTALLSNINNMEFFQRNYIYIILKSIKKYYLKNKEKNQFSELNSQNVKAYFQIIKQYLNDSSTLPNEEIFLILSEILNDNNEGRRIIKNGEENNKEENNENKRNINDNNDEQYFVFKYDKIESHITKINYNNIVERENDILHFRYKGEYKEFNFLSINMIFLQVESIYNDYFSTKNFDIKILPINSIINMIVNLLYYLFLPKFYEKDMALFLFKTIVLLKNLEKDLENYNKRKNKNS